MSSSAIFVCVEVLPTAMCSLCELASLRMECTSTRMLSALSMWCLPDAVQPVECKYY